MSVLKLPKAYTNSKFYSYAGNVTQSRSYLNGSCPICREGKNWGKKRRLYYFFNDDYLYCHNCFSGDTKILTLEYGPIEFRKIKNQSVTIKCKDAVWRKRTIQSYGYQNVYQYEFGNIGFSPKRYIIKATENHKWFIKRDKKRRKYDITTSLKIGDRLDSIIHNEERSIDGLVHGIIFGDGTYRKYKGEKRYAIIRICKQDSRKDEIIEILNKAGYNVTYPLNLKGDAYVNIGPTIGLKDIPNTLDPNYISGFVYGLWLTDGYKNKKYSISSTRKDLVDWMLQFASLGGFRITNIPKPKLRDMCFNNSKPIYNIDLKTDSDVILRDKSYIGIEEVFCLEEPITGGFYLDENILTGNCSKSWTPYFWVKAASGMSFKEIMKDVKDYTGYDSSEYIEIGRDSNITEKEFDVPDLPGDCVNLLDKTQLDYYSNYFIVKTAKQYCDKRRLFTALNAPKAIYVCIKDNFHRNRLIIPYYNDAGKIICYISRQLIDDGKAKYLLKFNSDKPLFNLNKIDVDFPYIFIFEGAIDSMFVKNAVAISGISMTEDQEYELNSRFPFHKRIWVFDNYRGEAKEVTDKIKKKLNENEYVFVYPDEFEEFKDLNEYCTKKGLDFVNPDLIIEGSYRGMEGLLKLN